jgi:hypothetical protein
MGIRQPGVERDQSSFDAQSNHKQHLHKNQVDPFFLSC